MVPLIGSTTSVLPCTASRPVTGNVQLSTNKHIDSVKHVLVWYIVFFAVNWRGEGHRGRGRMVGGFTATYAISAYHH